MLSSIFENVPDYRVVGRRLYKLSDLLTTMLLTVLISGEDCTDMSLFAQERAAELGLFTDCNGPYPSPDTFERVLQNRIQKPYALFTSPLEKFSVRIK